MTIFNDTFIPYEFDKHNTLQYIEERCHGIKKSLRFIEIDNEHLVVRCPLSGDYLDITGDAVELQWLHHELMRRRWYRLTS